MRTILNLHPWAAIDIARVWMPAGMFALTQARLSRCPACHTTVRVDDAKTLTMHGLAHAECALHVRAR